MTSQVEVELFESTLSYIPKAINKVLTHPAQSDLAALIRADNSIEFITPSKNGNYFNPLCKCHVLSVENSVQAGCMLEDGRLLLGCLDGTLYIVRPGDITPSVRIHSVGGGAVWSLAVRNNLLVMACDDGALRIGKIKGNELLISKTSDSYVTRLLSCDISPDGLYAVAGTADGQVRIFKTASANCMKQLKVPGAREDVKVWSVHWSPTFIIAGDSLGQTIIWDGSLDLANSTCFRAHLADVLSVCPVGSDRIFAAGIDNRTVQFVLEQKPNPMSKSVLVPTWTKAFSRRINNHDVKALAVFQNRLLLSGSADGVLKITPLDQAQSKDSDRFYSALPTVACVKMNGSYGTACIETGKVLIVNPNYIPIACINLSNAEHIVDHAITKNGKFVCVSTPVSCKFFEFNGSEIRKIVSFENFQVRFIEPVSEVGFVGLAGEELFEFEVEGDSIFRKKMLSLDFSEAIPTAFAATQSAWAVAISNQLIITNQGNYNLTSQAVCLKISDITIYAGLANNQLAVIVKDKVQCISLLKEPMWNNRPILGILPIAEYSRTLVYNENMAVTVDSSKCKTVPELPGNILHLSFHDGKLKLAHRPWEKVLQDLPPSFALSKYGMK